MSSPDPHQLAQAIRTKAHELGFERVGFAPAGPPARSEFLKSWLKAGYGGNMTYLNRTARKRSDPQRVLPGAQTIISVAQSYFTGRLPSEIEKDPSRGIIASYAWGQDYHDLLLQKLIALSFFLHTLIPKPLSLFPYTDTGPILERAAAERAGIGFVGKNTMLIAPKLGSTLFLGEIITTLELPPSPAAAMPSCGSCTRCQEICPTHAFPTAYVLNASLCISYLTIELKGIIPRALRSKMGNHIFGCDDCQTVCPWNDRFSQPSQEPAYRATLERQAPRLADLATLSEEQFAEKFAGSPVLRPGYAAFLRNVAVALGNWQTLEALEILEPLLTHSSPLVRVHAAWAAAQIPHPAAQARLKRLSQSETHEAVQAELAAIGD